ncbi:MAG: hypothetical protein LBT76_06445 [Tannerella sp.]|nr:hypothetical protein [Tannerella sp.]
MFDVKITQSGDDCDYILAADDFWHHFLFPGYHGALYPIVLSPVVGLFGMNLILLKLLSAVFVLLSIWLFYKSFRGKAPAVVLVPSLLLVSVCSYVFFYACHTYSEPLFMLMQGLFIYFFSKYFLCAEVSYRLKTDWRKYVLLAALALGLTLTRTIGYGVLVAVVLFFLVQRRWKDLLYMAGAILLVFGCWKIFQSAVWSISGEPYAFTGLLARDVYNPHLGMEDFSGLVKRFVDNSHAYFSCFLYQYMGLRPEQPSNYVDANPPLTVLTYVLYAVSLAVIFKRNKTLLFVGLYIGVMNFATFVLLHTIWAQDRLIMVYYPLILFFLLGGICYLLRMRALRKVFFIYPVLLLVLCVGTLSITKNRVARNLPALQQNLLGDQLYGWTPDWQNFVKGSQWAAKHLEKDAGIISRKPTISKVYTGRDFMGMHSAVTVPIEMLDSLAYSDSTLVAVNASTQMPKGELLQYIITSAKDLTVDSVQTKGVFLYAVPNEDLDSMIGMIEERQMKYTLDFNSIMEQCRAFGDVRIYDPEQMYRQLVDGKVDYLLMPQLRMDPTRKDGMYINTVHRYVWYISFKYQNRFRIVHVVGNDEPCEIVQFIR